MIANVIRLDLSSWLALAAGALLFSSEGRTQSPGWADDFVLPGANGPVRCIAEDATYRYYGGEFSAIETVAVNHVARVEKGTGTITPLGSGTTGAVYALAVSGSDVYVGGYFGGAGGANASYIAKWNGSTWSALGNGANGFVYALAVSGGDLYVGGNFTSAGGVANTSRIAKWNGSAWSALGTGTNNYVQALAVSGNDLYVGGIFTSAGGVANTASIAKWDGSTWAALGTGATGGAVSALAVSGSDLYAGGSFSTMGGVANTKLIAKWNGSAWSALGAGSNNGDIKGLAVSGNDLYVGGGFTIFAGMTTNHVAKWNGATWSPLGSGTEGEIVSLAMSGSDLYAGGDFATAGGSVAVRVARWNGSAWSAGVAGSGSNGVSHLVRAIADAGSTVYVAGNFTAAGGVPANQVARFDKMTRTWSALGSGITGAVSALATSGSDLYVGGGFGTAGGVTANRIAKWDGTTWSALGTGSSNGSVSALAVNGSDVYAGGNFTFFAGATINRIAKWDGTTWSPLGSGTNNDVSALAMSGTNLYVGGSFSSAGGVANTAGIARWNGSSWSALGTGINGGIRALTASGTDLYAGGEFTSAGGVSNTMRIAKWNGIAWTALGTGTDNYVYALAVCGSDLYVGGLFSQAGGVANTACIARWNGNVWSALGTGANSYVNALAASGNDLYAGGNFTTAGGKTSTFIGAYKIVAPMVTAPTISNLGASIATLGGNVTSDNGASITEGGVVYAKTSENADPMLGAANVLSAIATGTTGSFTVSVSGLTPHTGYTFKAYATNRAGTGYSIVGTFTTGNTPPTAPNAATFGTTGDQKTLIVNFPAVEADGDNVNITGAASGTGVVVDSFTGTAVTFTPMSNFAGSGSFTYTASDGIDTATGTIAVMVNDNDAPVVNPHANVGPVEAMDPTGAVVTYSNGSATDNVGVTAISYSPSSNTTFPIGTTAVTITAKDAANNTSTGSFTVTVQDTTGPVISGLPTNIPTTAMGTGGTVVTFPPIAGTDAVDGPVAVTCTPASGSTFAIGTTMVNCTATDAHNNTSSATFTVTVLPSANADLASLTLSGATLVPTFNPSVLDYHATVGNEVTSTTLNAAAAFPGASILQTPANPAPLGLGNNAVSVRVTAQDGTTEKIYSVTVKRTAPDTTKPLVTINAPTASAVAGPFAISGKVSEAVGLKSLTVRLNGEVLPLDAPPAIETGTAIVFNVADVAPENGTNVIEVEATDYNGNIGVATKAVTYTNNRPGLAGSYNALLTSSGTPNLDTAGLATVTVTNTGSFTGKLLISGVAVGFGGVLKNDGSARFKPTLGTSLPVIDRTELDSYLGALALSVTEADGLSGTLSTESGGTVLAAFAGKQAPYSAANPVPAAFLNQPAGDSPTKGLYTVVFPSKEQTPALDPALYPRGDGFASLSLSAAGMVSLSGYLGDGTLYKAAGKLRADGSVAVFNQLYRKQGAFGGELRFEDQADSDVSGTGFLWLRPPAARAQYYPVGWPNGLRLDAVGAKYSSPASFNFGQGAADAVSGNASLVFTDGLLSAERSYAISIDPVTGAVKLVPANATNFKLSLSTATGLLSGTFTHTDGKVTSYRGALLNKGQNHAGFGYFLSTPQTIYGGTGQSGRVVLQP